MISTWPQAVDVAALVAPGFQKEVFAAAIKSFEQLENPLRLNNFATALRELIRIILRDFAPDNAIRACGWYAPEKDKNGNIVFSRAQRIRYAVQAGLPDDFVRNTLGIDVNSTIKEVGALNGCFSKFTHIEPATFGVPDATADQMAVEALETFSLLYETIADCRAEVERAAEDRAQEALNDELTNNVRHELDRLATHYIFWGVDIESVDIKALDADRLELKVDGHVNCEFQYGSSGDVARDDGLVSDDSYPFSCRFAAATASPLDLHIMEGALDIDTNSFYE